MCISTVNRHDEIADSVRIEYQKYVKKNESSSSDTAYYSADMQKVVMLPRIPASKLAIFTKRMVAFHETFAPIGSFDKENSVGIVWNESISGRNALDLAAYFVQFIRMVRSKSDTQQFVIWADNYTNYTNYINYTNGQNLIVIKFFDEFVNVISYRGAALEMQVFDFISYPNGVSSGKYASEKPMLENVCEVQFRKGSEKMFSRESFNEEFKSAVFLKKQISREVIKGNIGYFQYKTSPRGLLSTKIIYIISKLCPPMPSSRGAVVKSVEHNFDNCVRQHLSGAGSSPLVLSVGI